MLLFELGMKNISCFSCEDYRE